MARGNDATWRHDAHLRAHLALPHMGKALCGVSVSTIPLEHVPERTERAVCDCVPIDLHERGEIRLVRRMRVHTLG